MKNKKRLVPIIIIGVFFILTGSMVLYFSIYYHADDFAVSCLKSTDSITVSYENGFVAFIPESPVCGMIFYPGAKVEYTAYAPLMMSLAEKDILCIMVDMPMKLAFLDKNAASGIPELYPQVSDWYIGGHSLGGAIAASYASENPDSVEGLILLAAYSVYDISSSELNVITIYGSNDEVLSLDRYSKNYANLPPDTGELVIDGGCHSYFGSYGAQKGDGTPTISKEEQLEQTSDYIAERIIN